MRRAPFSKSTDAGTSPRKEPFWERLLLLCLRLTILWLCAWIAAQIPLPVIEEWLPIKNVLIAVVSVGWAGKILIDTFFYDRFWP
jgi:hypothetical protein